MNELLEILKKLQAAKSPEEVFGLFNCQANELRSSVQKVFRALAKVCHEDKYTDPSKKTIAKEASQLLNGFWEKAQNKINEGIYGVKSAKPNETKKAKPICFKTHKYDYVVLERIHSGEMCGVFTGTAQDRKSILSQAIVKVPHSSKDNDLMEREARSLGLMAKKAKAISVTPEGQKSARNFSLRVPALLESIKLDQPGGDKKVINTFLRLPGLETGWFSLEKIRAAYPDGVDQKIMIFIWNRIIEAMTFAHLSGVVHCAITPNHVLIHAEKHMGQIIDWTASCRLGCGDNVPYADSRYSSFFPDEIIDPQGVPSPASDIFMSAWCMVYILGGDPKKKIGPQNVERPIIELLNRCLQPQRRHRPQTAEALYHDFREVTMGLFGPRKFIEFAMPRGMANA